MERLYLDFNIISYFRTGNYPKKISFKQDNIVKVLKDRYSIPFSPAHLEDIALSKMRYNTPDWIIQDELSFLKEIAENHSMRPVTRKNLKIYYNEYPIDCYNRVIEDYDIHNGYAEKIEKFVLEEASKAKNYCAREMNNIKPEDVLKNTSHKVRISLGLFFGGVIYLNELIPSLSWEFKDIKNRFNALELYINIAANILEEIRYYPEKVDKYSSRLHDVSHIIYASYCDIFVSEDQRLRKKTQAIYSLLKVPTKVVSLSEFKEILDNTTKNE